MLWANKCRTFCEIANLPTRGQRNWKGMLEMLVSSNIFGGIYLLLWNFVFFFFSKHLPWIFCWHIQNSFPCFAFYIVVRYTLEMIWSLSLICVWKYLTVNSAIWKELWCVLTFVCICVDFWTVLLSVPPQPEDLRWIYLPNVQCEWWLEE